MEVMQKYACASTMRNWKRLCLDYTDNKLQKRANKVFSNKNIIPVECFSRQDNIGYITKILDRIKEFEVSIKTVINSLCVGQLYLHNVADKLIVRDFINELLIDYNEDIASITLPNDENDIIGIIYQALLSEGYKNKAGSYYTPAHIIDELFNDVNITQDTVLLDPCCGSGRFLLHPKVSNPQNLYGFDIDENAVKIAKTNLLLRYKEVNFLPNIYCLDFLRLNSNLFSNNQFKNIKADYIITNPPWGTKYEGDYSKIFPQISSKELFSFFIVKAREYVKEYGNLRFVLPEAFVNVKTHKDIRSFILSNLTIQEIATYGSCFSNVISKVVTIKLINSLEKNPDILIKNKTEQYTVKQKDLIQDCQDKIFILSNNKVRRLLDKFYSTHHYILEKSIWGLGIVTGDNSKKLFKERIANRLPILTGKEIKKYQANEPKIFFIFDKKNLQQTASEDIYKAKEKLIYKFISNKLVFAYDDKQNFVLNSANILIPKIDGMSIKTVCAFLNSDTMQFIYQKSFNQIKVLKGNLCKLPFPKISKETDDLFVKTVDEQLNGEDNEDTINNEVYKIYNLTQEDIAIIKENI
ncbi:MAG: N-6 DNA methylase [Firmicutes bacterium]|nr:N-6 DNA methylase [Bacillota bacterium]